MRETLTEILDASAGCRPDHEYLRFDGGSLSYAQVTSKSNRIACALRKLGVKDAEPVAILTTKTKGVLSLYGVMKARAVAVPLDISSPPSRLATTIRDCGASCLVSEEIFRPAAVAMARLGLRIRFVAGMEPGADLPGIGITWTDMMEANGEHEQQAPKPSDVAYVLYTSGSTGTPKGIAHTHSSAVTFASWGAREFCITKEDRLGNHSAMHFDLSTFDLFAAACAEATTVLMPRSAAIFQSNAAQLIAAERITVWYSVPFFWREALRTGVLESVDLSSLRVILFAGERFAPAHLTELMRLVPGARFVNLFGPTETNVCVWHEIASRPVDPKSPIPIGRACPYADIQVDARDNEAGGELLVRGGTRMVGYWRNPELTREALTSDGYYRTGDFVRSDESGMLHFIGRRDRQVKVRGWRVELDEIECVLQALPDVLDCAVWKVEEEAGSVIAAAAVRAPSSTQTEASILAALARQLPPPAIPSRLTLHTKLQRTTTGKLDRRGIAKEGNE